MRRSRDPIPLTILAGRWTPPERAKPRDYLRVRWMAPARGHILPVQEIAAYAKAIRAGIKSRKAVAAEPGEDVADIAIENARDAASAKSLGLSYSVYPEADGQLPESSSTSTAVAALEQADMEERLDRLEAAEGA